jgi:hypothetical protein
MIETDPLVQRAVCENCQAEVSTETYCSSCGFPVNGNEEEKTNFRGKISSNKYWLAEAEKKIRESKIVIYVLAGITLIFGLIQGFSQDDTAGMVVNIIICLLYLICAAWSAKNPFAAILTSFIIYLTVQIISAIVEPVTLVQGLLWKVIFIGAFVKGIRSASEAQKHMKELSAHKVHVVEYEH